MIARQLSVFLENEAGHFLELSRCLGRAGVNISALSLAETAEYGIARMIVSDAAEGEAALREAGYPVKITDVLRVEMPDEPGALSSALAKLAAGGINVSYIYGYSSGGTAYLIMRVGDPRKAASLL
ncbi:MAG: ACT domain-containing protein [Clostridiales Family XIII bacterium]|nr:ACT domain-containing protein [Clostridiales Family XIII bacterium]